MRTLKTIGTKFADLDFEEMPAEITSLKDFEDLVTPRGYMDRLEARSRQSYPDASVVWTWEVDKGYTNVPRDRMYREYSLFGIRNESQLYPHPSSKQIIKVASVSVLDSEFHSIFVQTAIGMKVGLKLSDSEASIVKEFFKRCKVKAALETSAILTSEFGIRCV